MANPSAPSSSARIWLKATAIPSEGVSPLKVRICVNGVTMRTWSHSPGPSDDQMPPDVAAGELAFETAKAELAEQFPPKPQRGVLELIDPHSANRASLPFIFTGTAPLDIGGDSEVREALAQMRGFQQFIHESVTQLVSLSNQQIDRVNAQNKELQQAVMKQNETLIQVTGQLSAALSAEHEKQAEIRRKAAETEMEAALAVREARQESGNMPDAESIMAFVKELPDEFWPVANGVLEAIVELVKKPSPASVANAGIQLVKGA